MIRRHFIKCSRRIPFRYFILLSLCIVILLYKSRKFSSISHSDLIEDQLRLFSIIPDSYWTDNRSIIFSTIAHSDIIDVLKITQELRIHLLIADENILNKLDKTNSSTVFCDELTSVAFFIMPLRISTSEETSEKFGVLLKSIGFAVEVLHNVNPKEIAATLFRVPICIFAKRNILLHFIMLYERKGDFWWFGSLSSDPSSIHLLTKLNFSVAESRLMKYEGALDKFISRYVDINGGKILVPLNIRLFLNDVENSHFIECNHTRAATFETSSELTWRTSHEAQRFKSVLSTAKRVLDYLKIPYFLLGGTLLAYFRQCYFISYDRDIDLAIFIKDYKEDLIDELKRSGFRHRFRFGRVNDSFELSFRALWTKLDLYFFYEEIDRIWHGGIKTKNGQKYKFTYPRTNLCWTSFVDLKVSIPCDPRIFVEEAYGSNWNSLVRDWVWDENAPNLHENGFWSKDETAEFKKVIE